MKLPFFIARRYLFARKSHNIINLIAAISLAGVLIGTTALITVLSVFNGFESLVTSLFNAFNPDFQVTPVRGKTLDINTIRWEELAALPGVKAVNPVLEEKALLKYRSKQIIATVKGVEEGYGRQSGLDSMIVDGRFEVGGAVQSYAVCGYGVAWQLDLVLQQYAQPLEIYFPKKGTSASLSPADAFSVSYVVPSGVFSVQQEFDGSYVFTALDALQTLLNQQHRISSLEIRVEQDADLKSVYRQIAGISGPETRVRDKYQQEELLYKIMRSEKWAIFLILTFILLIAGFNVIGSVTMLVLEKKKDIAVLSAMGADDWLIRRIFLLEGWMISLLGAFGGLFAGFILCWLQQHYGLVSLGGGDEAFLVQAYPVQMKGTDFLAVFITVSLIGFGAAWLPVRRISRRYMGRVNLSS